MYKLIINYQLLLITHICVLYMCTSEYVRHIIVKLLQERHGL